MWFQQTKTEQHSSRTKRNINTARLGKHSNEF